MSLKNPFTWKPYFSAFLTNDSDKPCVWSCLFEGEVGSKAICHISRLIQLSPKSVLSLKFLVPPSFYPAGLQLTGRCGHTYKGTAPQVYCPATLGTPSQRARLPRTAPSQPRSLLRPNSIADCDHWATTKKHSPILKCELNCCGLWCSCSINQTTSKASLNLNLITISEGTD